MSETNVATAVLPVLDQTIEFMEEALKQSNADKEKIQSLSVGLTKLQSEQERIILEKVASAKATFFDKSASETMLAKLEGMGILDATNREKIARRLTEDPNYVFPLIVKVATTLMSAPGEGSGVVKEGGTSIDVSEDGDPDGWRAMAEGRPVAVKK